MSQDLPYNPQVFFWIAEYTDGTCLCQFDPDDGREVLFKHVDQGRLRSFGWYPVTPKLAELVKDQVLKVNPLLPSYRVLIGPGMKLIAHRQNHIRTTRGGQRRWTQYVLGYEANYPGDREYHKVTMRIDENGNVEMG